ncbi:Splicing factor 45 45 kDa-splicing factor RNA-binding motif protein 17 [Triplophysa tibetana]|uniref:Splicing factor 45 n=1 Tax=Triplophysa tibetana TaxID=1572043 RepID=A0A5A9PIZ7_9TELE|nr:Splicing factor 45 45 kDa-splicing factor RNA-binding motif protein 17 [Triplophysa tibetana]
MSLYDDLGVATSDTKTEGWSKNFKLLQSQLKVKKAALTQAKTQRTRQSNVLAPVIDLKRGNTSDDRQISDTPPHIAAGVKDSMSGGFSSGEVLIPLADEYDPMFPNDYEKVVKRHREERQKQREQERLKEIEEREKKRKERHDSGGGAPSGFSRFPTEGDSDEDEDYEREKRKRTVGGAAIAPPTSLMEQNSSFSYEDDGRQRSKAAIPPPVFEDSDRPRSPPGPTNTFLANMGGTVAHKIMQKYGFREGQGLGKHEQGLSTALSVEKTSKRGGKIIVGDSAEKILHHSIVFSFDIYLCLLNHDHRHEHANSLTSVNTTNTGRIKEKRSQPPNRDSQVSPTKVVLLRNMVGRGEVDEDLEAETKEECEKYGKVTKCVIFEIAGVIEEEAVRIFLEFERVESAIKAVVDLNGRYFGGRVVKASFYNLDKFRVLNLGEQM